MAYLFPALGALAAAGGAALLPGSLAGDVAVAGGVGGYYAKKSLAKMINQVRWKLNDMAWTNETSRKHQRPRGATQGPKKRSRTGVTNTRGRLQKIVETAARAAAVPSRPRKRYAKRVARKPRSTADVQYANATVGRQIPWTTKKIAKMLPFCVERFQRVNREGNYQVGRDATTGIITRVYTHPGALSLTFQNDTGLDSILPLHLYPLSAYPRSTCCGYRLRFYEANGRPYAENFVQSVQSDGITNDALGNWQPEQISQISASGPTRYARAEWYDIRLNLYGCVSRPTRYEVMLVRFKRPECDLVDNDLSTTTTEPGKTRAAFWQDMVVPTSFNTVMPHSGLNIQRGMKIVKRQTFDIPAVTNDDLDGATRKVQVKWFVRDGRILDYFPRGDTGEITADNGLVLNGGWSVKGNTVNISDYSQYPRGYSRMYLMVRANNTLLDSSSAGPDDQEVGWNVIDSSLGIPTYDLIMRRKMTFVEGN